MHDSPWVAFYDFAKAWGVRYDDRSDRRLALWAQTTRSGGWWWPLKGAVVLTERPKYLKLDEEGRLHNPNGPAIVYPDGWTICAIHGVRVPERVITGQFDARDITGEENAEVRRVMIERFGPGEYLRDAGAILVDESEWGKLWRAELADDEPLVMVEVVNSTPEPDGSFKDYWLRVPPTVATAHEAVAWTFDVPNYEPAVQT
jgi:hypothetical protein